MLQRMMNCPVLLAIQGTYIQYGRILFAPIPIMHNSRWIQRTIVVMLGAELFWTSLHCVNPRASEL